MEPAVSSKKRNFVSIVIDARHAQMYACNCGFWKAIVEHSASASSTALSDVKISDLMKIVSAVTFASVTVLFADFFVFFEKSKLEI